MEQCFTITCLCVFDVDITISKLAESVAARRVMSID